MDFEKQSIEILKMMCSNSGCWILDSGGKDSSILKHIAMKSGIPYKVEHSHTTVDAPETVYFVRSEKKRLEKMGIEYLVEYPKYTMYQLIVKNVMPPTRLARYCCKELKENFGSGKRIATGINVFNWWMEDKNIDGQLSIDFNGADIVGFNEKGK